MRPAIVLGTRPEIIKCFGLMREFEKHNVDYIIIDTEQQTDKKMKEDFFTALKYDKSRIHKINLSLTKMNVLSAVPLLMVKFQDEHITDVIVQGDTNSVLAGAIAASQMNLKIHHIEAGLRSGDYRMREEYNRIIVDRISDVLYIPTKNIFFRFGETIKNNAFSIITGNTVYDALKFIVNKHHIKTCDKDIIATLHRPENVDNKKVLKQMLDCINSIGKAKNKKVFFYAHPRTRQKMEEFKLGWYEWIVFKEPLNYIDMVKKIAQSKLIITDSGGIVEEACYFNKSILTFRKSTERPESVSEGFNAVMGVEPEWKNCLVAFKELNEEKKFRINPYVLIENGKVISPSERIYRTICELED